MPHLYEQKIMTHPIRSYRDLHDTLGHIITNSSSFYPCSTHLPGRPSCRDSRRRVCSGRPPSLRSSRPPPRALGTSSAPHRRRATRAHRPPAPHGHTRGRSLGGRPGPSGGRKDGRSTAQPDGVGWGEVRCGRGVL